MVVELHTGNFPSETAEGVGDCLLLFLPVLIFSSEMSGPMRENWSST